jgi:hypothetical protein
MEENKYRYFTLARLNDKDVEFGRVKVTKKSGSPLDAAKKLLTSICEYEGLTKNNKLKCKAEFYIRETTSGSKKGIYGPYKGSFKKYDKPVIVKLENGLPIPIPEAPNPALLEVYAANTSLPVGVFTY